MKTKKMLLIAAIVTAGLMASVGAKEIKLNPNGTTGPRGGVQQAQPSTQGTTGPRGKTVIERVLRLFDLSGFSATSNDHVYRGVNFDRSHWNRG